jgi:helicase domain protein
VARDLDGRRRADVARAHEIFTAFRRNLRETLAHLEEAQTELGAQLSLWGDDERRQYTRDIAQMRQRLDTLDEEEAREATGIEERYRDVRHYLSGVALVFAVSEADAAAWRTTDDEERTA